METGTPRRRVGRAQREQQILDAALAVFGERGYQAASMDQVAELVGVTKPVLYTHFGSKHGLLLACIGRARAELLEVTSTAAASAAEPEEMLRRGARAFFDHMEHNPAWVVLHSESTVESEALEGLRVQQKDFVATLLAVQAPDADAARLQGWAQIIVGACEQLACWRREDPSVSAEQATEYLMDLVWTGLAGAAQSSR